MGARGKPKNDTANSEGIYLGWRKKLPIEKQKRVLELNRFGLNCFQIAARMRLEQDEVWEVIENGVIIEKHTNTPSKCKECGGLIILHPCIRCQVEKGIA